MAAPLATFVDDTNTRESLCIPEAAPRAPTDPARVSREGCNREMRVVKIESFNSDGMVWRCPVYTRESVSIRNGSFYARTKPAVAEAASGCFPLGCWAAYNQIPNNIELKSDRDSNIPLSTTPKTSEIQKPESIYEQHRELLDDREEEVEKDKWKTRPGCFPH